MRPIDDTTHAYSRLCLNCAEHIVRRQRAPDTLERELTHLLEGHDILNRHQHPGTDQDLTGLGFVAKPSGDIGYRTDGSIVEVTKRRTSAQVDGLRLGRLCRSLITRGVQNLKGWSRAAVSKCELTIWNVGHEPRIACRCRFP